MNAITQPDSRLAGLIERLASRVAEAAIGRARLVNAPLRETLRERLSRPPGAEGGLLADPVLEAAFGYEEVMDTMEGLEASGLLHTATVMALQEASPVDPAARNERNTMPLGRHPYVHQLAAWRSLAAEPPRCTVVSSGTGSGKTEAFLVPILDRLAREQERQGRLSGVRALMLYPLNALIASQRDRLTDWTAPFGDRLRFGLYNGLTQQDMKQADAARTPWEVRDRKRLRADPPPILLTNATMLEYMLVRPDDAELLRRSRGLLRFVVLDEAHTYLGSQAAEMALLLRRTLRAFGVTPDQVSFVATSATLGSEAGGNDSSGALRRFMAQLADADEDRIDVVLGRKHVPALRPGSYGGLADRPQLTAMRARLAGGFRRLSELRGEFPAALEMLEQGMREQDGADGPWFLPLRLHLFHRAQAGVFACPDPACAGRAGTPLDDPAWPFGPVFERERAHCPHCAAVAFEVRTCADCGAPGLAADRDAAEQQLRRRRSKADVDDFARLYEGEDDEEDGQNGRADDASVLVGPPTWRGGKLFCLDLASGRMADSKGSGRIAARWLLDKHCPCCGAGSTARELFRPIRMGGAFFLATAGNVLLDAAPAGQDKRPHRGQQMITFTDNRQGTARFAASWQQDLERNFVRARIWHALAQGGPGLDSGKQKKLTEWEAQLDNPTLPGSIRAMVQGEVDALRRERDAASAGTSYPWSRLRDQLAAQIGSERELLDSWTDLNMSFRNPDELASLHLLGEFLRRPLRANSLETMGLASLRFSAVERLTEAQLPSLLRSRGATHEDWQDYLHLVLTFVVRANSGVAIRQDQALWIGQKVHPRRFMPPGEPAERSRGEAGWPFLRGSAGRVSRPVLILRDGLGLDLDDPEVQQAVNDVLQQAWHSLRPLSVPGLPGNAFQLDLSHAVMAPVARAWRCPRTHRLLDRTFRGLSPYSAQAAGQADDLKAEPVAMPRLPVAWPDSPEEFRTITAWLSEDPQVAALRRDGLWTDIADRLALLAPYARVVEHSAQQPADRLRQFESLFKRGEINVLNCSTTMEMGVDIGGITTVAMANVPPSPASYRQRVGRAGRRREALSVAFTYCPDTPIGWQAFNQPGAPLAQPLAPPRVAMDSHSLVQRHVNALLLAHFLHGRAADAPRMTMGQFLVGEGTSADDDGAPIDSFLAGLRGAMSGDPALSEAARDLVRGTVLAGVPDLAVRAANGLEPLAAAWRDERDQLRDDRDAATGAAQTALGLQLARMDGEYLLGELVRLAWLPGHGFPTGVVPFVVLPSPGEGRDGRADKPGRDDKPNRSSYPTRALDMALREYAPGSDVVLNGAVYRAGGVTLNWKRPASDEAAQEVQAISWFWICHGCGASGEAGRVAPEICAACSTRLEPRHVRRALRPSGFAADPDHAVNNAMDFVEHVPSIRPSISCGEAPWVAWGDQVLGRFRHAPDARMISSSLGSMRSGYALCLACGRAEPEISDESDAPLPAGMAGHRPLRRRKEGRTCEGGNAARPFAIQRRIALGFSRRTDAFELQVGTVESEQVAYTLAVALREALCRHLGVERDEVGCDARHVPAAGGTAWSMWLYDTAAGGAGYAGTAAHTLHQLVQGARTLLDCRNPGCETACPACLITRDTMARSDMLDRKQAAAMLDSLLPMLALPLSQRMFDRSSPEGERMAHQPLAADLHACLERSATAELTMFLHGQPGEWDLMRWWGTAVLERFAGRRRIKLLASAEALERMDLGVVLALRSLQERAKVGLPIRVGRWTTPLVPHTLLATVQEGGRIDAWASLTADGLGPVAPATVVRAALARPVQDKPLDVNARLQSLWPTVHRIAVRSELDGGASSFGAAFWKLLRSHPGASSAIAACGKLRSAVYTDRYLRSPLSIRLLYELLKAADWAAEPSVTVYTMNEVPGSLDGVPVNVAHDWRDERMRDDVLGLLLKRLGGTHKIKAMTRLALPHARTLKLDGGAGAVDIILDQGIGFWRSVKSVPFCFTAPASKQADELSMLPFQIAGSRSYPTELFVEKTSHSNGSSPAVNTTYQTI